MKKMRKPDTILEKASCNSLPTVQWEYLHQKDCKRGYHGGCRGLCNGESSHQRTCKSWSCLEEDLLLGGSGSEARDPPLEEAGRRWLKSPLPREKIHTQYTSSKLCCKIVQRSAHATLHPQNGDTHGMYFIKIPQIIQQEI